MSNRECLDKLADRANEMIKEGKSYDETIKFIWAELGLSKEENSLIGFEEPDEDKCESSWNRYVESIENITEGS